MHRRDCYALLRLRPDATLAEIKKAFRQRAKQLHPDQNPAADANEQFIRLHEAYEILTKKRTFTTLEPTASEEEERMEKARKAAANYARMKYEQYVRETELYHTSPYAWIFRILYYGLFLIYLFCAMVFASVPIVLFSYGIGWSLLSSPLWILSYFTFLYAYDWKKEIDPLFH